MSLPELPQELARFTSSEGQHNALKMFVREYGQACRKQALEEAAALCTGERWEVSAHKTIKFLNAFNEGCDDCAKAIGRLI